MSNLFKLNLNDLAKGAVTAVIAGFVVSIYGVVNQPGFDLFAVDWATVLSSGLNAAVSALVGYLGKNLLSDGEGKFLGKI